MSNPTLIINLLGLVILILIISPFFSRKVEVSSIHNRSGEQQQEKEKVFTQLSDLEYDYQMGKLSEHDYAKTKEELTIKAAKLVSLSSEDEKSIELMVDHEITTFLNKKGIKMEGVASYEK